MRRLSCASHNARAQKERPLEGGLSRVRSLHRFCAREPNFALTRTLSTNTSPPPPQVQRKFVRPSSSPPFPTRAVLQSHAPVKQVSLLTAPPIEVFRLRRRPFANEAVNQRMLPGSTLLKSVRRRSAGGASGALARRLDRDACWRS